MKAGHRLLQQEVAQAAAEVRPAEPLECHTCINGGL
jgi:hypothetical protein